MPSLSSLDANVYAKSQVANCRAESVDISVNEPEQRRKESLEMPQSGVEDLSFF